ncbi:MAG TPA: dTMP kinase [Gemmatimonadales bacterium]|nr:dTMP kinase [Gemmatimonadales bacterium]
MSRGFFLVIEGPEGAGKSTLARALVQRMTARGLDVVAVREPGGTPAAELARQALLDPAHHLEPHTELLFVTSARAHLVQAVIRPALEAGRIVVSDRYDLSTMAYQSAGRGLPAGTVRTVNRVATGGLEPDLMIVLDVTPEEGRRRQERMGKGSDRIEREGTEFHARVRALYQSAAGPGVVHLDAAQPPEQVLNQAWDLLTEARPETFPAETG